MMHQAPHVATVFAVIMIAMLVAHQVADHWVQSSHQAAHKGVRGWAGSRACAAHVLEYTMCTLLATLVANMVFDLQVGLLAILIGQGISAITHYWADRRYTLEWLASLVNRRGFYRLGQPREGHDDRPCLGTGAYALDQSWHWLWLAIAAGATATI